MPQNPDLISTKAVAGEVLKPSSSFSASSPLPSSCLLNPLLSNSLLHVANASSPDDAYTLPRSRIRHPLHPRSALRPIGSWDAILRYGSYKNGVVFRVFDSSAAGALFELVLSRSGSRMKSREEVVTPIGVWQIGEFKRNQHNSELTRWLLLQRIRLENEDAKWRLEGLFN